MPEVSDACPAQAGRARPRRSVALLGLALAACLLVAGCGNPDDDPAQVDALEPPAKGGCRVLTPEDVARPTNATRTVPCNRPHTAETYATGQLPAEFAEAEYEDPDVAAWAMQTCVAKLQQFLAADESLMMRTVVSAAWFGPSEKAWKQGARWYRCDVVGGGQQSKHYIDLPTTARALLDGRPDDRWMVCAEGPSVSGSVKVPCDKKHDWRAVSTIKLGEPDDEYPGDRVVQQRTKAFCSDQVAAYLGYPADYAVGFTWFPKAQWDAGNRRSVCWAMTEL